MKTGKRRSLVLPGVMPPWRRQCKTPGSGNSIAGHASTFDAVKQYWLFGLVLIAIASTAMLLCKLGFKESIVRWQERTLLLAPCRPVVVVILEQRPAAAVPPGLRLEGASRVHHLHPATWVAAVTDRRLGNVSAATLLFDCGSKPFRMQALGRRPDVDLRPALPRGILRHC